MQNLAAEVLIIILELSDAANGLPRIGLEPFVLLPQLVIFLECHIVAHTWVVPLIRTGLPARETSAEAPTLSVSRTDGFGLRAVRVTGLTIRGIRL